MVKVFVVEDHAKLRRNLLELLANEGYETAAAACYADARQAISEAKLDLVVLDLGLPGGDGLDLLKQIRTHVEPPPVMIMTARDTVEDRVTGLDAGADDYLIKSFAHAEFLARIRVLLRRQSGKRDSVIRFGGIELDFIARSVL